MKKSKFPLEQMWSVHRVNVLYAYALIFLKTHLYVALNSSVPRYGGPQRPLQLALHAVVDEEIPTTYKSTSNMSCLYRKYSSHELHMEFKVSIVRLQQPCMQC